MTNVELVQTETKMEEYAKTQKVQKWLEKRSDKELKAIYDSIHTTVDREGVIEELMGQYSNDDRIYFELATAAGISVEDLD